MILKNHSDFQNKLIRVRQYVIDNYGIKTLIRRLPSTITGDFNGPQIVLKSGLPADAQLFLLAHLFGHTVQFSTSPALKKLGMAKFGTHNVNRAMLSVIKAYEQEAARYGLQLLRDAGLASMDQWMSDWSNGDLVYLVDLYTKGTKYKLTAANFNRYLIDYIRYGSRLIKPLPIPAFKVGKWPSRYSF